MPRVRGLPSATEIQEHPLLASVRLGDHSCPHSISGGSQKPQPIGVVEAPIVNLYSGPSGS